ncbi:MAG: hypothetical protein VKL59_16010 [Nostocaceae cyanobacterium]|nr:hypothetical protein [Nostocaceae cyanobacterium]
MKKSIPVFGFVWLLQACTTPVNGSSQTINTSAKAKVENCPKPTVVYLPEIKENEDFLSRFDYHIRNITANQDTIKFQALKQDFVYCRSNNTWTVQPGTLLKELQPQNYQQSTKELVNPTYKNIEVQGKIYKYRVVQEPKFTIGKDGSITRPPVSNPSEDKVVFELITPNSKQVQKQTLYTRKDLQQKNLGSEIGVPIITAAVIHGNRIYWSISFEQGEGFSGIATVVNYEPSTNKFNVIQPEKLGAQKINDLVITGEGNNPTLWMGTQYSGEGNPYIPANGLVAYNNGNLRAYTVHNSPLVGAIPDKIRLENDSLWVGTGNGVCQVKWQAADNPQNWKCWRFAAMTKLPSQGLPLYNYLTNKTPSATLSVAKNEEDVEVLWWSFVNFKTRKGRYEVRYPQGFSVILNEGASKEKAPWRFIPPGKSPVYWQGWEWHWNGERFIRGFDEVASNYFGLGPTGIGDNKVTGDSPRNLNAIRGDLDLIQLSPTSTSVRYYSGWVDEVTVKPYLTVVPQERPKKVNGNPLERFVQ